MARVVLLIALLLFALAAPARGQPATIDALIEQLGDAHWDVRCKAAMDLGALGATAAPAVPALMLLLDDPNESVRHAAITALGDIGPAAVPGLIEEFSRLRTPYQTMLAAYGLERAGPAAVPGLIELLGSETAGVRHRAALVLGHMGSPTAAPAAPALIAALRAEDVYTRKAAAEALGELGVAAESAVPALVDMALVGPESDDVRETALYSLGRIGQQLKGQGTLLGWVVPRVYLGNAVALLGCLVAWFALASRVPKWRPTSSAKRVAWSVSAATPPAVLTCSLVYYAVTREWAQGFLPDTATLVSLPVASVLSTAFVCVLPAVWVCQRKPLRPIVVM